MGPNLHSKRETLQKKADYWDGNERQRRNTFTIGDQPGNLVGEVPFNNQINQDHDSYPQDYNAVTNNEKIVSPFGPLSHAAILSTVGEFQHQPSSRPWNKKKERNKPNTDFLSQSQNHKVFANVVNPSSVLSKTFSILDNGAGPSFPQKDVVHI